MEHHCAAASKSPTEVQLFKTYHFQSANKLRSFRFNSPIETEKGKDFVTMTDGGQEFKKMSGLTLKPNTLKSCTNNMVVSLTADFFHQRSGFCAEASIVDVEPSDVEFCSERLGNMVAVNKSRFLKKL